MKIFIMVNVIGEERCKVYLAGIIPIQQEKKTAQ